MQLWWYREYGKVTNKKDPIWMQLVELVWVGNCRKANGVLCDKKVPPRLKGFYKTKIRLISKKKRQQLDQQYFMEWNVRQKKKKSGKK